MLLKMQTLKHKTLLDAISTKSGLIQSTLRSSRNLSSIQIRKMQMTRFTIRNMRTRWHPQMPTISLLIEKMRWPGTSQRKMSDVFISDGTILHSSRWMAWQTWRIISKEKVLKLQICQQVSTNATGWNGFKPVNTMSKKLERSFSSTFHGWSKLGQNLTWPTLPSAYCSLGASICMAGTNGTDLASWWMAESWRR